VTSKKSYFIISPVFFALKFLTELCAKQFTKKFQIEVTIVIISCLTNENELKWIEMDSDFQKYWFTNVKMNTFQFWMRFIHIYRNYMEHISMPFNLKIILAFSVHTNTIMNTVQFKILNRKCSFSIQLHPIESKKSIRYLKYAFG